jgi:hypothetical protein
MILTIAIPTTFDRRPLFNKLKLELEYQQLNFEDKVEIIFLEDNKELSIGEKREKLYHMAKGEYCVQIDSDDSVASNYVQEVLKALESAPDAVGYIEHCTINGKFAKSSISHRWPDWKSNFAGWDYVRTNHFKTPIKTELCKQAGVPHIRFGEDHEFAKRVKPFIKTEVFIDKPMYYYKYDKKPTETHEQRYGIK